jgi:hypothetical protein
MKNTKYHSELLNIAIINLLDTNSLFVGLKKSQAATKCCIQTGNAIRKSHLEK